MEWEKGRFECQTQEEKPEDQNLLAKRDGDG
jgi:hypothetical protein